MSRFFDWIFGREPETPSTAARSDAFSPPMAADRFEAEPAAGFSSRTYGDPAIGRTSFVVCRYCGQHVRKGTRHYCDEMRSRDVSARTADDSDGDFFISMLVAQSTDNWLLGSLVGGNMSGAFVGQMLGDSERDSFTIGDDGNDAQSAVSDDSAALPVIEEFTGGGGSFGGGGATGDFTPDAPTTDNQPDADTTQGDSSATY